MITELENVFNKLSSLPEELQNQIAKELLEELEWEKESYNKLNNLVDQAKKEHREGKTHQKGFDEL